jgi:hypothetical protein
MQEKHLVGSPNKTDSPPRKTGRNVHKLSTDTQHGQTYEKRLSTVETEHGLYRQTVFI